MVAVSSSTTIIQLRKSMASSRTISGEYTSQ
jgi:hypothetical protein